MVWSGLRMKKPATPGKFQPYAERYQPTYWKHIKTFGIPFAIAHGNTLAIKAPALSVLLVMHSTAQRPHPYRAVDTEVSLRMTSQFLQKKTSWSKDKITQATRDLDGLFINRTEAAPRKKGGTFGSSEFEILNPDERTPLLWKGNKAILVDNKVRYFLFPRCVVEETGERWSLFNLSPANVLVYTAICILANQNNSSHFDIPAKQLEDLVRIDRKTFIKSVGRLEKPDAHNPHEVPQRVGSLETLGLIQVNHHGRSIELALCDPFSGDPLHLIKTESDNRNVLRNYKQENAEGVRKTINFNLSANEKEKMLLASVGEQNVVRQQNGNILIRCPFHNDRNPSCSVHLHGLPFNCWACHAKDSFRNLLMKLNSWDIGQFASAVAEVRGVALHYTDPDWAYSAIYDYRSANGSRTVKQVLRLKAPANGRGKDFRTRKPGKGGWVWQNCPPALYNLDQLRYSDVVCVVEGEKDADALTALRLSAFGGMPLVAVTSGGSGSWLPRFADALKGKQVIVLPDADESGANYAQAVMESLAQRGIEHRLVSFEGDGVNDLSEYLEAGHTPEQLAEKLGTDWVRIPGNSPETLEEFDGYQQI